MGDKEIVNRIQNWKKQLFVQIYEKYFDAIYRYIYYKTGQEKQTQDIVSETFLNAYEKINSFDTSRDSRFSSWLYMIAYNNFVDSYHNSKANVQGEYEWLTQLATEEKDYLQKTENSIKIKKIKEFLETVDEDKKEILVLKIRHGLSYDEISDIVWKTNWACRTSFSRLISQMKEKFGYMLVSILFWL